MADKEEERVDEKAEKVVVVKQEPLPIPYVPADEYTEPEYVEISDSGDESDVDFDISEVKQKETADFLKRCKARRWDATKGSIFVAAFKGELPGREPDPVTAGIREQVEKEVSRESNISVIAQIEMKMNRI
jgi:hypothetical protein